MRGGQFAFTWSGQFIEPLDLENETFTHELRPSKTELVLPSIAGFRSSPGPFISGGIRRSSRPLAPCHRENNV